MADEARHSRTSRTSRSSPRKGQAGRGDSVAQIWIGHPLDRGHGVWRGLRRQGVTPESGRQGRQGSKDRTLDPTHARAQSGHARFRTSLLDPLQQVVPEVGQFVDPLRALGEQEQLLSVDGLGPEVATGRSGGNLVPDQLEPDHTDSFSRQAEADGVPGQGSGLHRPPVVGSLFGAFFGLFFGLFFHRSRHLVCHKGGWMAVMVAWIGACTAVPALTVVGPGECAESSPPRLCLGSDPDRAIELIVGQQSVLPRECVQWPRESGGARLWVHLVGDGENLARRWLTVAPGRETWVRMDAEGHVRTRREPCRARR